MEFIIDAAKAATAIAAEKGVYGRSPVTSAMCPPPKRRDNEEKGANGEPACRDAVIENSAGALP